eukprot:242252_1
MSLKALDIYWSKTKSFAKSNWKYAASFALGSLISFATSYSFIKYLTGYNVREMIFGVLWRLKLAKYRNELEYKDFSYKPKIRPSSECMAIDEFFRSAPKGDPTATRDVFLDINSKYYYLKSRNNFNKLYMKHKLPTYMDTPKKITINNNWNNTNFELNGYLYTYPGCSIENGLLLYIHGGGFFLGTYMQIDSWITILMQKLGICVLSLDYQLCPEVNGIPNQVNQCIDSYKYILNKMGVDNKKIFIGGASAGGALSLLTIQKINELNLNEPCGGVIISLCADISAEIVKETAEKYNINDAMLGKAWSAEFASAFYINDDDKKMYNNDEKKILKLPSYSPVNGNFKGICPIYLNASENELLIGDSKAVLQKCKEANVDVEYLWDECLPHATICMAAIIPEARDSLVIMTQWMKQQLKKTF